MYEELDISDISTFPPLAAVVTDQIAAAARIPFSSHTTSPPVPGCASDRRHLVGTHLSAARGHFFASLPVDILVIVIDHCDWKTTAAWRRVSRAFFAAVAACLRRRYDELVHPYVTNVNVFNSILRKHAAIISGSTALYYFMPDSSWYPKDLDIYVADENWDSFLQTIQQPGGLNWSKDPPAPSPVAEDVTTVKTEDESSAAGSSRLPTIYDLPNPSIPIHDDSGSGSEYDTADAAGGDMPSRAIDAARGLRCVKKFYTPTGRRVDVIRSPSNNAITPLRFFWSSAVMNFLSPDACFCGFPRATLVRRGALKIGILKPRDRTAIAKYEARGYAFEGGEYREVLEMWDYLFFGERLPLYVDFRITLDSPKAIIPLRQTSRGWVPTLNPTLPTPGQYAIIPLDPEFAPLTISSNAYWILTMPLREPAYRLRLRLT